MWRCAVAIIVYVLHNIDGLMQGRRNSIANALDYVFFALTRRYI